MTSATAAPEATGGYTVDAFHRGAFHLVQPAGRGHRAGLDAMLLGASLPADFVGRVVDLGAGAGAAGLAVAARCPQARVLLVEREAEMIECATLSLALEQNASLARRVELLQADVTLAGRARVAAGLADGAFDFAIMNPPFNARRDRPSPDPLREQAHVMQDGTMEAWLRTAAAIVRPRGGLALIARPSSLGSILAAFEGRFGDARIRPILPRAGQAATRIVVRATRASRGELSLLAPLVVHPERGDGFTAEADAIGNGRCGLF